MWVGGGPGQVGRAGGSRGGEAAPQLHAGSQWVPTALTDSRPQGGGGQRAAHSRGPLLQLLDPLPPRGSRLY